MPMHSYWVLFTIRTYRLVATRPRLVFQGPIASFALERLILRTSLIFVQCVQCDLHDNSAQPVKSNSWFRFTQHFSVLRNNTSKPTDAIEMPHTVYDDPAFCPQDEFDAEMLGAFKVEAEDLLEVADGQLLTLESDAANSTALNALFRAFHTIKGNAGFLKIDPLLGNLAHDAETVLSLCRTGLLVLQGKAFELILETTALMRLLVHAIGNPLDNSPSADAINLANRLRAELSTTAQAVTDNQVIGEMTCEPINRQQANSEIKTAALNAADTANDFFEERSLDVASEVIVQTVTPQSLVADTVESDPRSEKSQTNNETLRVDRGRLDLLVELIGELVIAESMAQQDAMSFSNDSNQTPTKLRNLAQLNRITRTLQELSLSLRMVPLKSTFQKMTRIARDVMRKQNKQVDFVVEGEHTELDKTVVDEIGDPLMHMVRNAIDHGIENSTEERIASGKPARGRVVLRAFHQSGNIHIEIQDDGRGLNPEKILAKAKQQKIVAEDANPTESEILGLIFEPGFSTADKVTDVSGRGVGMDVVRRNIQALRGNVDIKSTIGRGSCFTIRMPLTLAIIDGLVVRVGSGRFVVPTLSVVELMQLKGAKISTIAESMQFYQFAIKTHR